LLHKLQNDIEKKKEKRKRRWVKKWIRRRNLYGASNILLNELAEEEPSEYRRHLRMNPETFVDFLAMIEPSVRKKDTDTQTKPILACTDHQYDFVIFDNSSLYTVLMVFNSFKHYFYASVFKSLFLQLQHQLIE
jgi:hypothetical protein